MRHRLLAGALAALMLACAAPAARADGDSPSSTDLSRQVKELQEANTDLNHRLDELDRGIDDVLWFQRMSDIAVVDKWRICGPPPAHPKNPKAPGAVNPLKFFTYSFVPKDHKPGEKLPLLILPHGGVHAMFESPYHVHMLREMMSQGYMVVAPDYRGSTGYGRGFYEQIDYGGLEVDDIHATKEWALQNFDFADPGRVGLIGWSHGGLIVLLEAFAHPKEYACVFAGVPVSDLVMRLGYEDDEYRAEYSAPFHIGKTVRQDIEEYKRRSPVWHVEKLDTPLLIHTNTNDEDVNYIEVEHLIQALKAAGKDFESKVYKDAPGGHSMDRMDTMFARGARADIYKFLAKHLHPGRPAK
ncbi:MAG: S9 family peptidase [Candidatus Eisenbacteria bacterium]|nr:S9 family peptidase [Candidatus Eisenbacteria bacterium]